jgi:hypothetical protein
MEGAERRFRVEAATQAVEERDSAAKTTDRLTRINRNVNPPQIITRSKDVDFLFGLPLIKHLTHIAKVFHLSKASIDDFAVEFQSGSA